MYFDDRVLFAIQDAQPLTMGDIMKTVLENHNRLIVTAAQRLCGRPARMYEGHRLIGF